MMSNPYGVSEEKPRGAYTQLNHAVGRTASKLQSAYLGQYGDRARADARGTLAELRRAAGERPWQNPLSLERVLSVVLENGGHISTGQGDEPSKYEAAAFHALTFFSLHMQSATGPRHRKELSFAAACGKLYGRTESKSFKPRFDAILLARNSTSQLTHIRSMITLLRNAEIGFDYGGFAADLCSLSAPAYRSKVLMRWGRDFALGPYLERGNDPDSTGDASEKSTDPSTDLD